MAHHKPSCVPFLNDFGKCLGFVLWSYDEKNALIVIWLNNFKVYILRWIVYTVTLLDFAIIYGKELRVHSFNVFLIFSFFALTEQKIKCYMTKYSTGKFMPQKVIN